MSDDQDGVSGCMFFLVPAYPGSTDKGPLNGCVCVCVCTVRLLCRPRPVVYSGSSEYWSDVCQCVGTACVVCRAGSM